MLSHFDQKKIRLGILLVVLVTAVLFRFYELDKTPPGLWVDEATNGTDTLTVLETGNFEVFYPANNGREGLFIGLQALSVKAFGNNAWALRAVAATVGVLTVLGVYILARQLFSWHYGVLASALMAVSFWHVNFSRISFRSIMVPLILTWAFCFLWRGLKKGQTGDFIVAGIIAGLGFYTYPAYRVSPLIFAALAFSFWLHLRDIYKLSEYKHFRNKLIKQVGIMVLTTFIVALPFLNAFIDRASDFTTREGQLSVLAQENPAKELAKSVVLTLGMFNFFGDQNLRHNIPGAPLLAWPMGIFFAIGFLKEFVHWIKRKPGHFSTTHTFLFSWFFVMLLPGFLSLEAPHALRALGVVPVVMIFTACGIIWTFEKISRWYAMSEPTYHINKAAFGHEAKVIAVLTTVIFVSALGIFEWNRYFNVWAKHPYTGYVFTSHLSDMADYLNKNPVDYPTFIVPNEPGLYVDGISIFAQPIKYLTHTQSLENSNNKLIFYINVEDTASFVFPSHYRLIFTKTENNERAFASRKGLKPKSMGTFTVFEK